MGLFLISTTNHRVWYVKKIFDADTCIYLLVSIFKHTPRSVSLTTEHVMLKQEVRGYSVSVHACSRARVCIKQQSLELVFFKKNF